MSICLDLTSIGAPRHRWTGVARMSWELSQALSAREELNVCFSAVGSIQAQELAKSHLAAHGLSKKFVGGELGPVLSALVRASRPGASASSLAHFALRAANFARSPIDKAKLEEFSVYFSFFARIPKQMRRHPNVRCGIYVHDLIPILLPHFCNPQQQGSLKRILSSIDSHDLVVVNSNCTKKDLVNYLDLSPDNVHVVPLAADPGIFFPNSNEVDRKRVRQNYGLPERPYYLSLHSASQHKNMPMLIHAYANYRKKLGKEALPLIIAGGKGDPASEILACDTIHKDQLKGITFVGYVKDRDLSAVYSQAAAFFFPSLYEGFGLPLLEAMFCGVPVYSSDKASLPEVVAPLSRYSENPEILLPACDTEAWTDAFERAADAEPLDENEVAQLRLEYSWQRAADQLVSLLVA